ncbi:MAG: nucleotide exchange factor GrpE [Planctomycetota bacterium]
MLQMPNPDDDQTPPADGIAPETRPADADDAAAPAQAPEVAAKDLPPPTPEELADLRVKAAERDEYVDLLKRTKADFANYQKRIEEDRKRWGAIAQRDLLARLMVAADQCRLAARKAETDTSAESLRDAICLVWSEVEKFLVASGARPIATVGESFDPERHEAVSVSNREDLPDSTVVAEVRAGYEFGELVLRPAQVVVSKRPKPVEETEPEQPQVDEPQSGSEGDEAGDGTV